MEVGKHVMGCAIAKITMLIEVFSVNKNIDIMMLTYLYL